MSDLSIGDLFLSFFASIAILWIAMKKGFFSFPYGKEGGERPTLLLVVGAFSIYFLVGHLVPPFFFKTGGMGLQRVSWASFVTSGAILLGLSVYSRVVPKAVWQGIWGKMSVKKNLLFALIAWAVAFPIVVCVGQLLTWFVYLVFHVSELPDQVAIKLMKLSFARPQLFLINGISIVIFAPLIEEMLFRGFLQRALSRWLPKMFAIAATSVLFAFFHHSKEQGLGNIPLLGSLFVFSSFLGFIYERQRSLFSSIALHGTFNALSIVGLYFLRE